MFIRIIKLFSVSLAIIMAMVSCHTREVAYLSDATRDSMQNILSTYTATILPGDQLYIYVSSETPERVIPFNQETHRFDIDVNSQNVPGNSQGGVISQQKEALVEKSQHVSADVSGYFVSEQGTIQFPVLGDIDVVGITYDSLSHYLEDRLRNEGYVIDPQVTIRLKNFRVTVVGEVRVPRQVFADGTRLTIFEALAICGDITDQGLRNNVTVVRSEGDKYEIGEIDLTKREMLESPYYYLHNNDIVYVEPNRRKKIDSDRDPNVPKYISIAVSTWNIINTNIRRVQTNRRRGVY